MAACPKGISRPCLLVIHSMEAPEKGKTAESCARFFQNANSTGSAHLCIDNNSIVQSVPFDHKAAGARGRLYRVGRPSTTGRSTSNTPGTSLADSRPAWSDEYSQAMLFWSAVAAAKVCTAYGIPAVAVDAVGLRSGEEGITTHAAVSAAFKVSGGHTDPGPGFPMASYVSVVAHWLPKA